MGEVGMILEEVAQVPVSDLPMAELRDHLRLGTGFGEDSLQDSVLESFLRAALTAIEGRVAKALIARDFVLKLNQWKRPDAQDLPLAPVVRVATVTLFDGNDIGSTLAATTYRLREDASVPQLVSRGACLPRIASQGMASVAFTAGYGSWVDVPSDLRQAVLLLAAHYYENRNETRLGEGCMPFGVTALLERYRVVRVSLGGAS
ncbi:head-tail connector protein [Roseobacteraceae bacterium S113]